MAAFLFGIWLTLYVLGMWTESSTDLVEKAVVSIQLTAQADWSEFFSAEYVGDLSEDSFLVLSKTAHVLSSVLLGLLFFWWQGIRISKVVLLLAVVTFIECMQEFFTRDSRILDVGLNALGVLIAAGILGSLLTMARWKRNADETENESEALRRAGR
ncbi:VanZ family protein [Alkalicoccus urumqiensis]|uniref:VanZ-like domain-containing protein n=1 Tax=Alkalicoccus urumqiensis TaxID=1548213 RepID=A0A2P6ML76_ALKUR|nr:VanZ family protein [Alkalicoccus urumqiensis]PRO67037.1 hypothetical protein C6I21_00275 [Alkalicoccus urumqiensis]